MQRTQIPERLEFGIASVYRALAEAKKRAGDQKVAA
jgi:hypothetical protein